MIEGEPCIVGCSLEWRPAVFIFAGSCLGLLTLHSREYSSKPLDLRGADAGLAQLECDPIGLGPGESCPEIDIVFLYISAKYENVVMYGDTAPDSSKCLANLIMKYSCAVGGPEEQLLFSVQSFLGLEDTMLGANEGDLVEPVTNIKLQEDLAPSSWFLTTCGVGTWYLVCLASLLIGLLSIFIPFSSLRWKGLEYSE